MDRSSNTNSLDKHCNSLEVLEPVQRHCDFCDSFSELNRRDFVHGYVVPVGLIEQLCLAMFSERFPSSELIHCLLRPRPVVEEPIFVFLLEIRSRVRTELNKRFFYLFDFVFAACSVGKKKVHRACLPLLLRDWANLLAVQREEKDDAMLFFSFTGSFAESGGVSS